jgi:Putative DNA-binding domain
MIFGNRPLREITEQDIRALVNAGMAEHLHLEYKGSQYENSDNGRREFLQDICMFANADGGVLLIGVPEGRSEDNSSSGIPDANAELGVTSVNPEADLLAYDARIVDCVEGRLTVESHAIPLQSGRFVLAFRVRSSIRKPHCVVRQQRKYFPSRRERHRYEMDLREIKEQTMRAASQLERAEELMRRELEGEVAEWPQLFVAQVPAFYQDFLVDITREEIVRQIEAFDPTGRGQFQHPNYTFVGLQRYDRETSTEVTVRRNGMLTVKAKIPGHEIGNQWQFQIVALDLLMHEFAVKVGQFYVAAELDSPAILGVGILTRMSLFGQWGRGDGRVPVNGEQHFIFPFLQINDPTGDVDSIIRPICDHVHQMFGRTRSSCFDDNGRWRDPRG